MAQLQDINWISANLHQLLQLKSLAQMNLSKHFSTLEFFNSGLFHTVIKEWFIRTTHVEARISLVRAVGKII